MSIEDRLKTVLQAESDCNRHSSNARLALVSMKEEFREAATPWRIVTVGVIVGFIAGRSGGGNAEGGNGLGGKLFAMLSQAAISSMGAAVTAGFAAEAATDPATEAPIEETGESVSESDPA